MPGDLSLLWTLKSVVVRLGSDGKLRLFLLVDLSFCLHIRYIICFRDGIWNWRVIKPYDIVFEVTTRDIVEIFSKLTERTDQVFGKAAF